MTSDFHDLLQRARSGDAESLDGLVRRHYPAVQRLVHRWLAADVRVSRRWSTAMFSTGDVVHDVFVSVLHDLGEVRAANEQTFAALLASLVRNRIMDAVRRHEAACRDSRRAVHASEADACSQRPDDDPAFCAEQRDAVDAYRAGLANLRHREQELLRRRLELELPFQQLATELGYPSEDAARKAFGSARARLLSRLARSLGMRPPGRDPGSGGRGRLDPPSTCCHRRDRSARRGV
ncbi:MAG: sigma-70 family RNA polymerase sigma factor [Planctomycetes bacterium]|nr:sigma-70 family RNA polymerase sigma factor [Planctomycetota bacterium]